MEFSIEWINTSRGKKRLIIDNFPFILKLGYAKNEQYENVLNLYEQMNVKPDDIIYIIVLNDVGYLGSGFEYFLEGFA